MPHLAANVRFAPQPPSNLPPPPPLPNSATPRFQTKFPPPPPLPHAKTAHYIHQPTVNGEDQLIEEQVKDYVRREDYDEALNLIKVYNDCTLFPYTLILANVLHLLERNSI